MMTSNQVWVQERQTEASDTSHNLILRYTLILKVPADMEMWKIQHLLYLDHRMNLILGHTTEHGALPHDL